MPTLWEKQTRKHWEKKQQESFSPLIYCLNVPENHFTCKNSLAKIVQYKEWKETPKAPKRLPEGIRIRLTLTFSYKIHAAF